MLQLFASAVIDGNDPAFNLLMNLLFLFVDDNYTDAQLNMLVRTLRGLQAVGIDTDPIIEWAAPSLPIEVRARLHAEGLYNFPLWQRNVFLYYFLRWFLFGWIWMP